VATIFLHLGLWQTLLLLFVPLLPLLVLVPGAYVWDRMHGRELDYGPVVWREDDAVSTTQDATSTTNAAIVKPPAISSDHN
jgi:uncharacterized iron-regulated membrane protein